MLLFSMVFLYGCLQESEYFTTEGGIKFQLKELGDSDENPQVGQILSLRVRYFKGDSLFYNSGEVKMNGLEFHYLDSVYPASFSEVLHHLQIGDSAETYLPADNFFENYIQAPLPNFLAENDTLCIHVRLVKAQSESEFEQERMAEADLMEMKELAAISNYLAGSAYGFTEFGGIHYRIVESSFDTNQVLKFGDQFQLQYEGRFVNGGNLFYSTYRNGFPDEFSYGQQEQLIRGLEMALSGRMYGDSLEVVIPSTLAFGQKGSAGGLVPGYTPLRYNLRILPKNSNSSPIQIP